MADDDYDTLAYERAAEQAPVLEWLGSRLVGTWEISGDVRGKVTYEWMDGGFLRDTLDYVYELEGDTLTIWAGERDSPAYYRGTFGDDGHTLTGAWHHPGATVTRRLLPRSGNRYPRQQVAARSSSAVDTIKFPRAIVEDD
jgi:hypothetical protein